MTNPIGIVAIATIEAAEDGSAKTFTLQAYNGGTLSVSGYDLPIVVDLATLTKASEVLANLEHNKGQIVGHVSDVTNNGKTIAMAGILSYEGPSRERVLASAKAQFPWKASIEVRPGRVDLLAAGQTTQINGQTFRGPLYIAREGTLYGVAFVPRGADSTTQVLIAASAAMGAENMSFEEFAAAMGLNVASLTEEQKTMAMLAYEGVNKPSVAASHKELQGVIMPTDKWSVEDIRAAHSDAMDTLEAKIAEDEDNAKPDVVAAAKKEARKKLGDIKATAIREKWTEDKYAAASADVLATAHLKVVRSGLPKGVAIHAGSRDISGPVIEAALCQRLKQSDIESRFDDQTLQTAHTLYNGRLSVQQMLIQAAAANGYQAQTGERVNSGNLAQIMRRAFPAVEAADGPSTYSLSGILSNVANKELALGYMEVEQSWRQIARIATVNDFKQATTYRLNDNMEYELLPPSGSIKHGSVSDESYTRQAKTYAKMFSISRQAIINDDLSAFDDMRTRLGRGAARKLNRVFWTAFLGNLATSFTSTLTNYISGSTTNLGTDGVGLGLGVKAFRALKSTDGKVIGGEPVVLLTGQSNEYAARSLFVSQNLVGGSSTVPAANIYYNRFTPVICPFIEDSTLTGYSTTAWWLFRNPSDLAPMVVSFLDGQQAPTVDMADADFDQLGVSFRGYHDFGCDVAEPFAGIMSKGAA